MDDSFADTPRKGRGRKDLPHIVWEDRELAQEVGPDSSESKSKRMVSRPNSQETLTYKLKQPGRNRSCIKESYPQSTSALDSWIPKHMVTVDEKYLRRCLELIHDSASKAAPCNVALNLGWGDMGLFSSGLYPGYLGSENAWDLARFSFERPLPGGNGSLVVSAAGQWILGSIMGSKSMKSILKSPTLHQYGALDGNANYKKLSLNEVERPACYTFANSPGQIISSVPQKPEKEAAISRVKYGYETVHNHNVSMSSTNSTSSDKSSLSLSASVTRGMLQCIWKGEEPHFVFSLDNEKVVYLANMGIIESRDGMAMDYVYFFHSQIAGQKVQRINDTETQLVGKMMVSSSFTFCPDQSRILEREFVLFGCSENLLGEMHTSSYDLRKNKGLSKKVSEVFGTSHSIKKKSASRFGGSSATPDQFLREPLHGVESNFDVLARDNFSGNYLPPNFELAAVVVRDHLPGSSEEKVGGWGLKFLKKVDAKQTTDSSETIPLSCVRDAGNCSTSMDIILPAGYHGGPRTRNGGPYSLTERWRSGGCCDCGGWDLGCPLTLLKSRSSNKELSSPSDTQENLKFLELYMQGSQDFAPSLRMVNVHDGLYFVHFQSTLSALQSFSIAVAIIHAQSVVLRPKNVQESK